MSIKVHISFYLIQNLNYFDFLDVFELNITINLLILHEKYIDDGKCSKQNNYVVFINILKIHRIIEILQRHNGIVVPLSRSFLKFRLV